MFLAHRNHLHGPTRLVRSFGSRGCREEFLTDPERFAADAPMPAGEVASSRVTISLGALSLVVLLLGHGVVMAEATGTVSEWARPTAGGVADHAVGDHRAPPLLGCPAEGCAQMHPAAPIAGPLFDAEASAYGPGAARVGPREPRAVAPNWLPVTQSPGVRRSLLQVYRE